MPLVNLWEIEKKFVFLKMYLWWAKKKISIDVNYKFYFISSAISSVVVTFGTNFTAKLNILDWLDPFWDILMIEIGW